MTDHVDHILGQWASQRPDLDVSPMAVLGRIKRFARVAEAEQNRTFAAHGLDAASFDVLATLRRNPPPHRMTPTELMRDAMVTSGAITQRLDRLQDRGLVTRGRNDADGRGVHVSLTKAGKTLIDKALPDHLATQQRILAALGTGERDNLARILRTLLESSG
ncbi:MarR family transcriptional regulator [Saccharomonospora sp. NPDC006951]